MEKTEKDAFGKKEKLPSKAKMRFPDSAERELKRVTVGYIRVLQTEMQKEMPQLLKTYKEEKDEGLITYHGDELTGLRERVYTCMRNACIRADKKVSNKELSKKIKKVLDITSNHSLAQWREGIRKTIKEDPDLYDVNPEIFTDTILGWHGKILEFIENHKELLIAGLWALFVKAYGMGMNATDLEKAVTHMFAVKKRKAGMDVRDIIGDIDSDEVRNLCEYYGCETYIWVTMKDDRVRPCHRQLHGREIKWSEPPEMWYMTKHGIVYTGRRCHPGQDYGCRCVARPVFPKSFLMFKWKKYPKHTDIIEKIR